MGRPRKIKHRFWLIFHRKIRGKSIDWLANKYKVSKRTIWRHLK
jgi:hypothetical protein